MYFFFFNFTMALPALEIQTSLPPSEKLQWNLRGAHDCHTCVEWEGRTKTGIQTKEH